MKSLRFLRLSSLQEDNFVKVVYGNNRKFSGYVTGNDHKKSLEILNSKGELLVIEYSEIKSFILKNKNLKNISVPEVSEIPDRTDISDNQPDNTDIEKTIPEEETAEKNVIVYTVPESAEFFSNNDYIKIPEIKHDYIVNLYNGIEDKNIKNIVTKYFNSFMAGDKNNDREKCISAVAGFKRYFAEYSENINAVKLLAFMYAYNQDFSNACEIFAIADDYWNVAVYAYISGNYKSALLNSFLFVNNQLQNNNKYPEDIMYILIRSSIETDNVFYISELIKNYSFSELCEQGLDYLLYIKNSFNADEDINSKLSSLGKFYNSQRYEFGADISKFSNNVMFGHIFDVNGLICSVCTFSNPGKKYTFNRSMINQAVLSGKLADSETDVTKISVAFTSKDGQRALNVQEIEFSPEAMANMGKKYFDAGNYKSALDCFFYSFYNSDGDEQKEEMFFHIVHFYSSLAEIENKIQNYKSLRKFADKYSCCVSDKYRLNEIYFNIFKALDSEKDMNEYLEKLIDKAESSEKKLIYIKEKAEILYNKNLFSEALETIDKWNEIFRSSDSMAQELCSEMETDEIPALAEKCILNIRKNKQEEVVPEPAEIIPEPEETVPEPEITEPECEETDEKPKESVIETKPEPQPVKQQNQEVPIVMPSELGILPEPSENRVYSVEFGSESKKYDVQKCGSEINKFLKGAKRDAEFIKLFAQRTVKMNIFREDVMKFIFDAVIEKGKCNSDSVDAIISFFYSRGMFGKINGDSENEKYYFITQKGADVLNKEDIKKKKLNILKGQKDTLKICPFPSENASAVSVYMNHYEIISEAVSGFSKKYFIECETLELVYFKINTIIFKNKSVILNTKDECTFIVITPSLKDNINESTYKRAVKKLGEFIKIKSGRVKSSDKLAFAVISESYGSEWVGFFEKIFKENLFPENFYISSDSHNFTDYYGKTFTPAEIISAMLSETPPENRTEDDDISGTDEPDEEDESYCDFMNNSSENLPDSEDIKNQTVKMLCSKNYSSALTYLNAVSKMNEKYLPFYNLMSMALDNPAEDYIYTSGSIFDIPQPEQSDGTEMYEYCITACKLRALYYSDCHYDYSVNSFADDIKRSLPAEKYPELRTLADILCDFRKEFNIGMDSFSDYCMKDKLCAENGIQKIQAKAVELYKKYCNSKEGYISLRIKKYNSIIYSENEKLMNILDIVCKGDTERLSDVENFLSDNFIRKNGSISDERITEYIKDVWDESLERLKSERKTANQADELPSNVRNHSAHAIKNIACVLLEWIEFVVQGNQFTSYEKAYEKYQQKRETVLGILNELIMATDLSETALASVLNRTLRDICERMDGSYNPETRKYYYIDFLKDGFITLDENNIPDLSSTFCSLEGFSLIERIIRHTAEPYKSFEKRLEEIFGRNISDNDYGSGLIIYKYLSLNDRLPDGYSEKIEKIDEYFRFSEREILRLKNSFTENMELAECKGQFYQKESLKQLVLKIADIWYKKCCQSHNYGFYVKLIESLENMTAKKSEELKFSLDLKFEKLKNFYNISEQDCKKISSAIENCEYTVALSYMSLVAKGENLSCDDSFERDFFRDFWNRYSENYRKCTDEFICTDSSNLISSWISDKRGVCEKNVRELLEKLGWKNCNVVSAEKKSGVYERFSVTAENNVCPVSVFRNNFDVLCIFKYSDCKKLISDFEGARKNNTIVFVDYAFTEAERRHIAKEIKSDSRISKAFPIADRVTVSYLENCCSCADINNTFMLLTMPFAKFQPYEISESSDVLSPVSSDEAEKFISLPMKYMGIYFEKPEIISLILADSDYCSEIINYWCHTVVESVCCEDLYNDMVSPPYVVTENHIKRIIGNRKFRNRIKNFFLDVLDKKSYLYIVVISHLCYVKNSEYGYTADEIQFTAESYVSSVSENNPDEILENLCNIGILVKGFENRYFFFRENFCNIIGSQEEIEDMLLKYME